jgi:hypothetical protein
MTERKIGVAAVLMALSCALAPIVIGALVALAGIVL